MPVNESLPIKYTSMNVQNCFKNFYLVPDYQREYVWGETQVNQLLSDLMESYQADPTKEYFLGSVVVYQNEEGFFELIDGQQRTTTFFLMICAFRQLYKECNLDESILTGLIFEKKFNAVGDPVEHFRLSLQYSDAADYVERISRNETAPALISSSGKRLFDAYEIILETLRNNFKGSAATNESDKLKLFFMFFYQKVIFIQIETSHIGDALKIFETINQRGIGLNPVDLLKNLIFRQVDKQQFSALNLKWKSIVDGLDSAGEKPLRFIRYFIMANYDINPNDNPGGVVREDGIYNWFIKNDNQCQYQTYPQRFVDLMKECQVSYVNFIHGKDRNGDNVYLESIAKLGGGSYKYHLMLLLPARNLPEKLFMHLCRQVESVIFYVIVTKQSTNDLERLFAQWSAIIKKIKTADDLNLFISNYMIPEIERWKYNYKELFMVLSQKNMQQYRIRYILSKIAQYMDMQKRAVNAPESIKEYFKPGIEIEHILPYKRNSELLKEYSDEAQYDMLKSRLGNLTLLEKVINIVIGNQDFYGSKLSGYDQSQIYMTRSIHHLENIGIDTSVTALNRIAKSWSLWDENTIVQRQEMLYELSLLIWTIVPLAEKE